MKTLAHRFVTAASAAALAFAIPLSVAPAAQADQEPNQAASLEKSIVYLRTSWSGYVWFHSATGFKWSERLTGSASCTGFFVSAAGDIATAGHCLDTDITGREALIEAFLYEHDQQGDADLRADAMQNWSVEGLQAESKPDRIVKVVQPSAVEGAVVTDPVTAQVMEVQPFAEGDNALIKISTSKETPPLVIADQDPAVGESLTSIGFPGVVRANVDAGDSATVNRPSFKTGTASSQQTFQSGAPRTEVNIDISGGMSGGPTVDQDGRVVGINSSGYVDPNGGEVPGINYITDATDLHDFLASHDVKLAQLPSPAKSTPWALYAGIAAAVIVLLGAALLLYFRKKAASPESAAAQPTNTPQYGPPTGSQPQQQDAPGPPQQPPHESQKQFQPIDDDPVINPFSV